MSFAETERSVCKVVVSVARQWQVAMTTTTTTLQSVLLSTGLVTRAGRRPVSYRDVHDTVYQ